MKQADTQLALYMIQQPLGKGIPILAGGKPGEFFEGAGKLWLSENPSILAISEMEWYYMYNRFKWE